MSVLENLKKALRDLNGTGTLKEIYEAYSKTTGRVVESTIRRTLQQNSSDSKVFTGIDDAFFTVEGIGNGVWGLRNFIVAPENINKNDQSSQQDLPDRKLYTLNRIVRDTALALVIKDLANYTCQLCEIKIQISENQFYIEAHHIKPLGKPHNGPDTKDNILIVCPNCHVMCDHATFKLSLDIIKNNIQIINPNFIEYHNSRVTERGKASQ